MILICSFESGGGEDSTDLRILRLRRRHMNAMTPIRMNEPRRHPTIAAIVAACDFAGGVLPGVVPLTVIEKTGALDNEVGQL